jgi:HAD superfamily phosphatase (TIGR01668 family)
MRGFRAGTFERDRMPRTLRRFSPSSSLERVEDVDLAALRASGKSLVLLDVDNTLLPWRTHEFQQPVLDWIAQGKALGMEFCILSNTRHPERLQKLSETLDVPFIRDRFKPSRKMYDMALEKFGRKPEQAVMIGDQLLTDVLGANRAGIDAVWIKPMHHREFIGTRMFSRNVERLIGRALHDYFQPHDDSVAATKAGFFQHNVVRQFIKFCLVGGMSTVIDLGLHYLLMFKVPLGDTTLAHTVGEWAWNLTHSSPYLTEKDLIDSAYAPLKIPVVILAILNSYYWNRRWTFRVDKEHGHGEMIVKFFVVALIGMVLNVVVGTTINRLLHLGAEARWAGASLIATAVVVFWNFTGQKLWTFRKTGK